MFLKQTWPYNVAQGCSSPEDDCNGYDYDGRRYNALDHKPYGTHDAYYTSSSINTWTRDVVRPQSNPEACGGDYDVFYVFFFICTPTDVHSCHGDVFRLKRENRSENRFIFRVMSKSSTVHVTACLGDDVEIGNDQCCISDQVKTDNSLGSRTIE